MKATQVIGPGGEALRVSDSNTHALLQQLLGGRISIRKGVLQSTFPGARQLTISQLTARITREGAAFDVFSFDTGSGVFPKTDVSFNLRVCSFNSIDTPVVSGDVLFLDASEPVAGSYNIIALARAQGGSKDNAINCNYRTLLKFRLGVVPVLVS